MGKITVILIFGGKSTEHEVSIKSAKSIYESLDKNKYNPVLIGITKKGSWIGGKQAEKALKTGSKLQDGKSNNLLLPDPTSPHLIKSNIDLISDENPKVVFPVLHGLMGEDGTLQGLLEMANIAYVGCGVLASALGMDKVKQKEIMKQYDIKVVEYLWFKKTEWKKNKKSVLKSINEKFNNKYPLFVKPANSGSSVGVYKAHNRKELEIYVKTAMNFDQKILIEKGMEGVSEIEVSILGNNEPIVSVCGEIIPQEEFYSYEAKYLLNNTVLQIPAQIDKKLSSKIQDIARRAFLAIDGSGMSRADFFVNRKSKEVWLNELNTIPGFTSISMYPKLWEYSGISYKKLVDILIELALERWKNKQSIKTSKD